MPRASVSSFAKRRGISPGPSRRRGPGTETGLASTAPRRLPDTPRAPGPGTYFPEPLTPMTSTAPGAAMDPSPAPSRRLPGPVCHAFRAAEGGVTRGRDESSPPPQLVPLRRPAPAASPARLPEPLHLLCSLVPVGCRSYSPVPPPQMGVALIYLKYYYKKNKQKINTHCPTPCGNKRTFPK